MKINEIIKSKRIELGLTQEDLAKYLHVSTPAVNKWEKGVTHPDITLLPIIGRLLNVDMNTLLSFKEDITDEEIGLLGNTLYMMAEEEGMDKTYDYAMEKIREYPSSDKLIFNVAILLKGILLLNTTNNKKIYEEEIENLLKNLFYSEDMQIREMASLEFIHKYIEEKEFDKAKELIDGIYTNSTVVNKDLLLAKLYNEKGEIQKSKEILERKIFMVSSDMQTYLNNLMIIFFHEDNLEMAKYLANKSYELSTILELPIMNRVSAEMSLAILQKNIPETLKYLDNILSSIVDSSEMEKSKLYNDINIKDHYSSNEFKKTFLKMIIQGLKEDEENEKEYEFIKDEENFQKLIIKYERALSEMEKEKTNLSFLFL